MNTPIADFVKDYAEKNMSRFHMPGHKGKAFVGCELFDITEVSGADALYEAEGIIAESEKNATSLFGTGRTVYSTEGSSQCIRAMLYLAVTERKTKGRPVVLATRNVHKAFIYAAALVDFDVEWLWPEMDMNSLCSCIVSPAMLEAKLKEMNEIPAAVYVTSPDYLGQQQDISALAEVCHRHGTILAVDNAHGAYLHFTMPAKHPIDLGADICCDSAHKTLPVLTGGAYLHISKDAPENFIKHAKKAMALFGSTSPSYLIMHSLDLCNKYLADSYSDRLFCTVEILKFMRNELRNRGWKVEETEPLKLTISMPEGLTGMQMAELLRGQQIECEFADPEYLVFMFTPENTEEDYQRIYEAFEENTKPYVNKKSIPVPKCVQKCSIREAVFAKHEEVPLKNALGRICGTPTVSCPPAIPIAVSGEEINEQTISLFEYYGMKEIDVLY